MKKWEYLFVSAIYHMKCGYTPVAANAKHLHFKDEMCIYTYADKLGDEGWELVSATESGNTLRLFFKRPKEKNSAS